MTKPINFGVNEETAQYVLRLFETVAHDAAQLLEQNGWAQDWAKAEPGELTMVRALKAASQWPGAWFVVREILRDRNRGEAWCKAEGRTQSEVVSALRELKVVEPDVITVLGPRWLLFLGVYTLSDTLSEEQNSRLDELRGIAWASAQEAATRAASGEGLRYSLSDSRGEQATWCAARGAAWAVGLHHVVGKWGFEQHHYDILMMPWSKEIGPLLDGPISEADLTPADEMTPMSNAAQLRRAIAESDVQTVSPKSLDESLISEFDLDVQVGAVSPESLEALYGPPVQVTFRPDGSPVRWWEASSVQSVGKALVEAFDAGGMYN